MPYAEGRVVHDADAHIMETPTWLRDHAEAAFRDRMPVLRYPGGNELRQTGDPAEQQRDLEAAFDRLRERHGSAEYRADEQAEIMARKNFAATGSFIAEDRPRALDLLGFSSQLVFNTFHNGRLHDMEHADVDLAYAAARAHNRGMLEFCSVDERLLPSLYVPLCDPARAVAMAGEALAQGAAALLVASGCPPKYSPSHTDLFGVWAQAEEAGIPVVFHVGGTGTLTDPHYFVNGLPVPPDFHGGEENFRSVDYMGIPVPPAQTLATLIFDGVLERFPGLRVGVIEQGAIWVPSWLRQMESAFEAFVRHEERLQALSMRPSDYVHRQVRFTPYPTEDVGWIVAQAGADLVLFSSDYPHVEGGRKPLERFEASLDEIGAGEDVRRAFYTDNFLFLMGERGGGAGGMTVTGLVEPGFEGVRDAFAANFEAGHEVGAALCVHAEGRKVVDLHGGWFDTERSRPYGRDALQLVFSSTKGATATCANLLAQRGQLDLDAPVATYWPEFAQAGKETLPVRYLLTHQAGLPAIDRTLTQEEVWAWDPVASALAAQTPFWEPGTAHGYHALTYGYLVGEVVWRVTGRTIGTFFAEEVAGPLGLDFYIGLPEPLEWRVSPIVAAPIGGAAQGSSGYSKTLLARALNMGGALRDRDWMNQRGWHAAEVPGGAGITNATSLSRMYAGLIGTVEGGPPEPLLTRNQMEAARTPATSGPDQVFASVGFPLEQKIGLGFWRASPAAPFGGRGSFGHSGAGGSYGFADPEHGLAVGYAMNKMADGVVVDPRSAGIVSAVYAAVGADAKYI